MCILQKPNQNTHAKYNDKRTKRTSEYFILCKHQTHMELIFSKQHVIVKAQYYERICLAIWHHESKTTCENKRWEKYGWTKRTHRFREIRSWTPQSAKTIFAKNSPNHPGNGITLRQRRSTSHIIICEASAAKQWNSRQRRQIIENHTFRRHQRQYFMKF